MTVRERRALIDALIDGAISEADFLRLEAVLSIEPEARRDYYERVELVMLLESEAKARAGPGISLERARSTLPRWRRPAVFAVSAAASLLLAAYLGFKGAPGPPGRLAPGSIAHQKPGRDGPMEQQVAGFAVVAGQANADWEGRAGFADGALIPPGRLRLVSGVVHLEFLSGVSVIVEGEAEFSITSSMEMFVDRGKVRAVVPEPAQGFLIRTQQGVVVDLGTEFGVAVAEGHSEVHVLDGKVEWRAGDNPLKRLSEGQALRRTSEGSETLLPARREEFLGPVELQKELRSLRESSRGRWLRFNATLKDDPRLVLHYQVSADEPTARRLTNRAARQETSPSEGVVVAAVDASDRWGRPDGALDFSPTGGRVRLSVPGEYRSLTFLCWVKINGLDRWYNSLFLTDGHEEGEPHWQIMDDGRLFFSVKKRDHFDLSKGEKDKHIYYSPPFWRSELCGRWLMLATVYDVEARRVRHYLDGQVLSEEKIPEEYLVERVRVGNASIGNWGLPERGEPRFAVRNLNGSLDEFAMFGAALSSEEILEVYENGRP